MIDGKYMHTYIHTHVFDDVHFRKTYQSDILFPPSKIFRKKQILAALTRNLLNMLVIVSEGIQNVA